MEKRLIMIAQVAGDDYWPFKVIGFDLIRSEYNIAYCLSEVRAKFAVPSALPSF